MAASSIQTTMTDGTKDSKDIRKRPQTPHDFSLLKTIRYEDTADGVPPVPVASINPPKPPSSLNSRGAESKEQAARRPRTSPSPKSRTHPHVTNEVKRDSGIAPSVSTIGHTSYAESHLSSSISGAAKEPSLPTIVVQDDEVPSAVERSRSPFAKRRSKDRLSQVRSESTPRGLQRINSFEGIQSDIPSGSFEDLDLEDLASDKVGFSHRGSLLFGGKKMNQMLESQSNGGTYSDGMTTPVSTTHDDTPKEESLPTEDQRPKPGLVSGRRKPSVQMLQAAIESGRLLSAEEIGFSLKVRSMYEAGDEQAAEWTNRVQNGSMLKKSSGSLATDSSTPDLSIDDVIVGKTRQAQRNEHPALRKPRSDVRASYAKEVNELAGGIEDWDEVDGQDVDRYGFIKTNRVSSRSSTASHNPGEGIQRVATSLRMEAEQPRRNRKLRRGPSIMTRTSRSVPPRSSTDGTHRVGSVHSQQSDRSLVHMHSGNPFRSREKRTLEEAADMLTLPPGLADIAEQEDAGRTASLAKRREWAREEKWQKMARPVRERSNSKGGGMMFDFDTNDQKVVGRTWKGIPDRWRATAWHSFISASARRRGRGAPDEELIEQFHKLQEESSADDVQIDVDVPRTINLHIMFRRRYRGGQRLLFRVLHAISLYFPDTGYVQGMASLAATLLCYYDEGRAFVMMVRLWQLRGLEQLFQSGFEGLMTALNEFEKDWLGGGEVAQQLEELGITSTAYGTRWYLTLFNMSIPFPAQLRVWDAFMLLGDAPSMDGNAFGGADLDVLHAASAALIDATREIILDSDFENAMKVLTSFIPIKDEDLLMRVARAEWKLRKKRGPSKT